MTTHIYTAGGDGVENDIPWRVTKIQLDSNVREIPNREFHKLLFLEELECSTQLQRIGDHAVGSCAKLQTIDLRKAPLLEQLGEGCFQNCASLTMVWLAPKIRILPPQTFSHCSALRRVQLNEGLQEIQPNAFEFCRNLKEIDFKHTKQLIAIGSHAFYMNESLRTLTLPDTVRIIKRQAFQHCRGLRSVTFGSELVQLSNQAFAECSNLDTLDMSAPRRLRILSEESYFKSLSLRRIHFSPTIKAIRTGAFARCSTLTTVEFPPLLEIIDDRAFERCTALVRVDLPNTTKSIGYRAFALCTSLKTVTFPKEGLVSIERQAFSFCKLLEQAKLPDGMDETKIGLNAFYGCPLLQDDVPNRDLWVYNGIDPIPTFVEHVIVANNVKTISSEPFDVSALCTESNLTTIQFHHGLEEISAGAFSYCNCPGLTTLSIPSSVIRFADPFDQTFVSNIEIVGKVNLALAIRLKLLYPHATPTLTLQNFILMYSYDPIQSHELLPIPTDWASVRSRLNRKLRGSYNREKELVQSQSRRERDLLKEIQLAHVQAIHRLLLWCLERGLLIDVGTTSDGT